MSAPERTVFGRAFRATPLALWILQRASGLLLAPLVAVHVLWPALGKSRPFLALLVIVIVSHGYTGVRRLRMSAREAGTVHAAAIAWTLVVAVAAGTIVLLGKLD